MQVHCPSPGVDGSDDATIVDHVKLFRNLPDLRFEGRIHEQIIPAIRRAEGDVAFTDIFVVHSGSDQSPESRKRKFDRDFRILHRELKEEPDHPFVLFNLGMTYGDAGQHEQAVHFLTRSIDMGHPGESQMRKAYALLAGSYLQLDRPDDAWRTCAHALELYPDDKELLFRRGIIEHHQGRLEAAEATYRRLLDARQERHFASVDRGLSTYKARHNLVAVYDDMGRLDQAEQEWRAVLKEFPEYRPAWRGLGELLLRQGKFKEAEALAKELTFNPLAACDSVVLAAQVHAGRNELARARELLEQAITDYPSDQSPLLALCQLQFSRGTPAEAELVLRQLVDRQPADPCAHHNLGTVLLRQGKAQEAVEAYGESIRLRPESATTWTQYGFALDRAKRLEEAAAAWRKAIEVDPQTPWARQALSKREVITAAH